jgi:HD-like signal output (HDOD) protein/CheY-like chemotaxis protein
MFVDDDPMLLSSTRRQLVTKLPECELGFFDRAANALEDIEAATPDIIFSDVRMPEIDGPEFLRRVAQSHPEIIRFAWTGQSEADQLERVFKVAHQVFGKPCPTENLREIISTIMAFREHVKNSPLLPKLTHPDLNLCNLARLRELLRLLDDPQTSGQTIAERIDESAVVRARLLALANSSFFAPPVTISQTIQAVTMIGFGVVKAVLLGSQFAAMSEQSPAVMVELKQSLNRGTEIALRVNDLASRSELDDSDRNSALIAAMFHRFGKVQFAIHGGKEYTDLKLEASQRNSDLDALERKMFGVRHNQVAAYLLSVWGMDTSGCKAIAALHERPDEKDTVLRILQQAIGEYPDPQARKRGSVSN